jgi:hypothetical protein
MVDHDLLMNPERWRDRALETRTMARNAYEPQDRERLLKVARAYDRLAARAFDWKTARQADRLKRCLSGLRARKSKRRS